MLVKITRTEIRPSTDVQWCRAETFGSEYDEFKHTNDPNVLDHHVEISDDELSRTVSFIVDNDWDRWQGLFGHEKHLRFVELMNEHVLKNNIIINEVREQID